MKIVIPDDYQLSSQGLDALELLAGHQVRVLGDLRHEPAAPEVLAEAQALVLIRERTPITEEALAGMPALKVISQTGRIGAHIDLAACSRAGVAVLEGVGSPTAPAEFTWLMIMAARRNFVQAVQGMQAGRWQSPMGRAVQGDTLGILGFGKIGKLLAGYAQAFGMRVQVWGSERALDEARLAGLHACASREALFESSDVLSVHLRLAPGTQGSITAADLGRMKPGALFVNTSRFELLAAGALEAALDKGRPGAAALDVFESEPVYAIDHGLLSRPNVLCTPHMGYVERGSYELYFASAIDNLLRFEQGERSLAINAASLPAG
ncbi:MAG: D-2-hydroxyacid dehydrogenase family protein [Pseudomonas sp.]|uniref:D-2-hydroxyacid dehydrogenase family protein n=1 Tax=Pseudomonas sp. TaxID=306 RepID=UPI0033954A53